jgi:hypothetical protein
MKALSMAVAGLGMLSFTAVAHALPLCGTGFGPCRPGLELGAFAGPKAADEAQRDYDLISGNANTAPQCLVGRL